MGVADVSEKDFSDVKISVFISLLAWPITYFVESEITKVDEDVCPYNDTDSKDCKRITCGSYLPQKRTLILMTIGFVLLSSIIFVLRIFNKQKMWLNYVFGLFAFTSMIDLIIGVELKGWTSGFMTQYLNIGEPYLSSPWGCAIVLFDGTFIYIQYLILIHSISNKKSWRSVGIYWVSGLINSMIVLLFGVASGRHSPTFCTFLNVPYALFPIYCAVRLFSKEKDSTWSVERIRSNGMLFDVIVAIGLAYSIWIAFAKGMLSIGSTFPIFRNILSHEPALLDVNPAPFAIIQSLVYLLYALPIMLISLVYIFRKTKPQFVWELALINGGLMLQGQFSFIVTALDYQTPAKLRSDPMDSTFWINNLVLLIAPQLFILSLYKSNVAGDGKKVKKNK